jgi:hypothetical protein
MDRFVWILSVGMALLAGCTKPDPPALRGSAEKFTELLGQQLSQSGAAEPFGNGGGWSQAGNIYTKEFIYLLPPERFDPEKLDSIATAAMEKWGQLSNYSTTGVGGGNEHFGMDFGTHRTHAFIDALAYHWKDKVRVVVLMRVVQ